MPFAAPKTALVTGGARRIGRAIVEDLAAHGYAVAIHAYASLPEAETLAAELVAKGAQAIAVPGELAELDRLDEICDAVESAFGPIGLLVNNASIFGDDDIATMTPESFLAHMTVNAAAPIFLAQAFARRLPEDTDGLIVNVTDQRVRKTVPTHFSYGTSKATLDGATRTLAQALAPRIRVNAIAPGPTLPSARQAEADFKRQTAAVPLKHGPSLAEFGQAVRFFVEATSVTGQTIVLDGGQHLGWETPDVLGIEE